MRGEEAVPQPISIHESELGLNPISFSIASGSCHLLLSVSSRKDIWALKARASPPRIRAGAYLELEPI